MREVQLQWPYLLQMGFVWDLLTVYCTCVFVPWARTFREVFMHPFIYVTLCCLLAMACFDVSPGSLDCQHCQHLQRCVRSDS